MHAERLLEAAMGRAALQLHDGLRRRPTLIEVPEVAPPKVGLHRGFWRVRWDAAPRRGRLAVAARLLAPDGSLRPTDGPFVCDAGRYLWCGALDGSPLHVPTPGVPAGTSELDLVAFALGRGPARAVAHTRVALPAIHGQPWDPADWVDPLVVLGVALVHADGVVRSGERHALTVLLRTVGLEDEVDVDAILARATPARLDPAVRATLDRLRGWGPRTLLEKLVAVAVANGAPGPAERAVLLEIADRGGVAGLVHAHGAGDLDRLADAHGVGVAIGLLDLRPQHEPLRLLRNAGRRLLDLHVAARGGHAGGR